MQVRTRVQEFRKLRALSAADLAQSAGVSRQTVYAIEDGSFVPNTTVALRLARALNASVEELFAISEDAGEHINASLLDGQEAYEGQLVRLCHVNNRLIAVPISSTPAYLPHADGVVGSINKRGVSLKSSAAAPEDGKRLLLAGCDPALSVLNELLGSSGVEILTIPSSSRRALEWLKHGKVHAAGSHLLDRTSGDYNLPIIRRLFAAGSVRVLTFAVWEQGLVVKRGNPKSIRSAADLASSRITVVNRERGSGSRDLLDKMLRQLGIPTEHVKGYSSIAPGHLAAAYAVAAGHADCCIAPQSAARCFGLDFVALAVERFDLSFTKAALDLPAAKALLDVLHRSALRKKLESIAGYDTAHTGEVLI